MLMQNGSAKEMHGWGVMNFIESDDDKSDTYYMARFLEERGADTFAKMVNVFSELEKKKISLGVVVVYDMLNNTYICISDGARSLYVDLDLENQSINYFSSLDDSGDDGYSFYGWFVWDNDWRLLQSEFKYLNQYIEKKTYPITSQYGASYDNRRYDSATWVWITGRGRTPLHNTDIDDETEYYANAYANQAAARSALHSAPPSWGDMKAPKSNVALLTDKVVSNQTALIVTTGKEEALSRDWESKESIENALKEIRKYNKDYEWLDCYSDDMELDVVSLLETNTYTELEEYFYDRYRDAQIRIEQDIKWRTFQRIIDNLEECMRAIQEELDTRKNLWIDNFYEIESPKEKRDTFAIDKWIEDKMDTLRFHMVDIY